ncbi:MAG: twitching motility protein PilT [Gammaproteobacteria bacterium RIFCSPHIGHO2_12_FULL_42_13]|nr:MAG: twitching motility protein PilT [Gammaproteobacteria bacterium RIFCSPHIGHO2_12_FULL_42_13]
MTLATLLDYAVAHDASDLHLTADEPPRIRIDGKLSIIPDSTTVDVATIISDLCDDNIRQQLTTDHDIDFAFTHKKQARVRANVYYTQMGLAAAFRLIPAKIPNLTSLKLPNVVDSFTQFPHGLVLVTGPTGSGKSTTLAAMINDINLSSEKHIITIEDPIEYLHRSERSLIHQREIRRHAKNFQRTLRAALREDPDILMLGEMRDLETIRLALTAAETGHLVFATLHTPSTSQSIYRIVDAFPSGEKELVRMMLADSLQAVMTQTLIPKKARGRVAAMEIMIANTAIRNLIRENKIAHMATVIQTSAAMGMQTMQQHVGQLRKEGII